MSIETINEEIRLTNRMLAIIEKWDWYAGGRSLTYGYNGHTYRIEQLSHEQVFTGEHIVFKTMFYRDDKNHRFDGPSYIWHGKRGSYPTELHYINDQYYTKAEFNFFIKGMITA